MSSTWVYVKPPQETAPRQCKRCGQLYFPELGHNCPGTDTEKPVRFYFEKEEQRQ